ncbi:MAG TPA: N-formylglutamate amidohydrolase [Thermoanaerobaculia bacterium]|nr:N-formylglutamate amidohydrolase [Thermoanaerobaculia bacterium]
MNLLPFVTSERAYTIERSNPAGERPLVAAALHGGHRVRPEVEALLALSESERLREEDPFTAAWTAVADSRILAHRSRFEVDLNRPPEGALYLAPEQAWGLEVWRQPPPPGVVEESLAIHRRFYEEVRSLYQELARRHGRFVVFDLHSYNHRRGGRDTPPENPAANPEVNVGTGSLDRSLWGPVVDRFMTDLAAFDFRGRRLDVRENVRFQGGAFARWSHREFPGSVCVLAIEWKKFFMDEWTGEPRSEDLETISAALAATVPGVLEELVRLGPP